MARSHCLDCPNIFQPTSATKAQWIQLKSLLRGNSHPSRSPAEILQLLSGAETDLQRCDAEIVRQQSYLFSLQNQRVMLQRHVEGYKSLVSPIRKIPPEILRQIFQHVCLENRLDRGGSRDRIPGLKLARVCSQWLSISLATKSLWSTIDLDLQYTWDDKVAKGVDFLLERSAGFPLTLSIDRAIHLDRMPWLEDILRALAKESRRWVEFRLGSRMPSVSMSFVLAGLASIKGKLPLLRSLTLPDLEDGTVELFRDAPQLQTVDLSGLDLLLPWDQLREVKFGQHGMVTTVLNQCQKLNRLHLSSPASPDSLGIVPNVDSFTLEVMDEDFEKADFLSCLTLPTLTELSLMPRQTNPAVPAVERSTSATVADTLPMAKLFSFISRSGCTLTVLSWNGIPVIQQDWHTLLHSLPSLHTLSIIEPRSHSRLITNALLEQFRGPTSSWASPVLPALQNLSITRENGQLEFNIEELLRMLQSRWLPDDETLCDDVACLKSFKLHLGDFAQPSFEKKFLPPFEQLALSGMNIFIKEGRKVILC
ncbi:hypothetical protein C8J56DRAFT_948658 [Mycena floridula]|nr:hypothetical protein C8J56DRAFT_948658 [Mycena floridula]